MTPDEAQPSQHGVFEAFVLDAKDHAGLMAYALYKRDKRDLLISWHERYGSAPTPDQIAAFVAAALTPGLSQRYREDGQANLDAYAKVALERERPRIVESAIIDRMQLAATRIESSGAWYRQIPAGIASALAYTLLLLALLIVLRYAGVDLQSILDNIARPAPGA